MRRGVLLARRGAVEAGWKRPAFSPITATIGSASGGGNGVLAMFNVKPAGASAPTVAQSAKGGVSPGTSATATLASAPTVGNTLYTMIALYTGTITPPTGFTSLGTLAVSGTLSMWIGGRTVQSGDGTTYTATWASTYGSIDVIEVAGGAGVDQFAGATAGQSPYTMPPITATVAKTLAFCVPARANGTGQLTVATPSGWTLVQSEASTYGCVMTFDQAQP